MFKTLLQRNGFTLIELSIVLVIIGLIVGGILTGRDLIKAAAVRSQITQIEKFQQAKNTFRIKYGYMPGDIKEPEATQFGFMPRGQYAGEGDGNGALEGVDVDTFGHNFGVREQCGETMMFWVDLAAANLIAGNFLGSPNVVPAVATPTSSPAIKDYFPTSVLRDITYVYVYSGDAPAAAYTQNGVNYFAISALTQTNTVLSNRGVSVREAYDIDKKLDDGFPQSGAVLAQYLNFSGSSTLNLVQVAGTTPSTTAIPNTATGCVGNNNVAGVTLTYDISVNGGAGVNCALSFKMQ